MSNSNRSDRAPYRLAIVGFGLIGRRHAQAIAQVDGCKLTALVDPSAEAACSAQALGLANYPDLDAMLADAQPDGVILATPTTLHVDQALACVTQGCPVLIEKPLATAAQDASALLAVSEANGIPILVGHHRRHNPLIQKAKALIDDGEIGTLRAAQATCWFYKPDDYFAQAPWRTKKGAGPISVNLVHDIDLLRYLCGEVVSVQAQAAPALRGFENEDLASALLRFQSGALGTITVSDAIAAPWSWEMTAAENPAYPITGQSCYQIGGSLGSLSIPDLRLWRYQDQPDWWQPMAATVSPRDFSDPLVNQIAHFIEVISGRQAPLVSGREGLRSLQVVEAIQTAAQTGETVRLD